MHPHSDQKLTASNTFESLGVYLPPPLSLQLMACLAAGRPFLLYGIPGQAKTQLARAIGEALAPGRARMLNAALTSFDDIRGFVRPGSLESGRVEIVPGPWSPYDDHFLFVDELSRAPTLQQGRWLQLLHERLIDGQPTAIRWVIAAMNPPSIDGTFPLGLATADRFLAVLALKDFRDFPAAARIAIAAGRTPPKGRVDLGTHVAAVAQGATMIRADSRLHEGLAMTALAAVDGFSDTPDAPFRPQGRRAFLIAEYLVHLLAAIRLERGNDSAHDSFLRLLPQALEDTLGHVALAVDIAPDHVASAMANATRLAARIFARQVPRPARPMTTSAEAASAETLVARAMARKTIADEIEHPSLPAEMFAAAIAEVWTATDGSDGNHGVSR